MRYSRISVLSVWIVLVIVGPPSVYGQERSEATVRSAGAAVNLFETVDPRNPIDGLQLRFPTEWVVQDVQCFRYGTEPVAGHIRSEEESGMVLFVSDRTLTGPHEIVVQVRLPEREGSFSWELHPLVWRKGVRDSVNGKRYRVLDGVRNRVDVTTPSQPKRGNHALDVSQTSAPVLVSLDRMSDLGHTSSFTMEFWMQTNGLGEIVLSTWNGNETVPYPAEFVVGPSGRIRFYSGEANQHQALRSGWPVADGRWHHVAAVYDAPRSTVRLLVDGRVSDSLQGPLPALQPTMPLAIGGRVHHDDSGNGEGRSTFSGRIDAFRIWPERKTAAEVRRGKDRSYLSETEERDPPTIRLAFDSDATDLIQEWPKTARLVPVSLSFQTTLREFEAQADADTVTLRWATNVANVDTFIIERSEDGNRFASIAEVEPSRALTSTTSGVPMFTYTDRGVPGRVMYYRLRIRQHDGDEATLGSIKIGLGAKKEESAVELLGNFPNPFSEKAVVAYTVHEPSPVTITIWDLDGHRRTELVKGMKEPGYYEASLSAAALPSGTYFLRLETPDERHTRRMVVLK